MVAKSYFVAFEATLQRSIVRDVLGSSGDLLRLSEDRLRIGVGDDQAVADTRASLGTYRDTLGQIEYSRAQALRALASLVENALSSQAPCVTVKRS